MRRGTRRWVRRRPPSSRERWRARGRRGTEAELGVARRASAAGSDGSVVFTGLRRSFGGRAAGGGATTAENGRERSAAAHGRSRRAEAELQRAWAAERSDGGAWAARAAAATGVEAGGRSVTPRDRACQNTEILEIFYPKMRKSRKMIPKIPKEFEPRQWTIQRMGVAVRETTIPSYWRSTRQILHSPISLIDP